MKLELLPMEFTVCQVREDARVDTAAAFTFYARTDEEASLVCPTALCPEETVKRQDGWRCFRVAGPLDFSLTGILARIADCLARAGVPIFAVSTYNTDYVLIQKDNLSVAVSALQGAGYEL